MPRPTASSLRHAFALATLLLVAACSSAPDTASPEGSATGSAAVGEIGGEVTSSGPLTGPGPDESPATESTPAPTPAATATPPPTPAPQADGFTAAVRACQSISGSSCNGEYGTMPAGTASFTALVTFTDANAGDTINVVLTGPAGTFAGGPYTLGGGGDGYYYSNFSVPNLGAGTYTLTASRNGSEVATTTFTKDG
jgi:hypothetical protein